MKKISRKLTISLICVASVVAVLFVAVMVYYFGASYKAFDKVSKKEFQIPGLDTSFTPQGLAYVEEENVFLVSGYMSSGDPSRVYVVNKETGETKYATFKNNIDYVGHAGGVATYGGSGWLSSDGYIYRFDLDELLSSENGAVITFLGSLEVYNEASWLTIYEDKLIVGEFQRNGSHTTDISHHFETADKKVNKALALAYPIDETKNSGVGSVYPRFGISMPALVQGMCFTSDGKILLSTSYSVADSHIRIYDKDLSSSTTHKTTINGITLNCHMLDSSCLVSSMSAPCMTEGVALANERVFVLFENNCKQYRAWTRSRLSNVFSLEV